MITTQSNNDLFSQIFLGKVKKPEVEEKNIESSNSSLFAKQKQGISDSLTNSAVKTKEEILEEPEVKIADF